MFQTIMIDKLGSTAKPATDSSGHYPYFDTFDDALHAGKVTYELDLGEWKGFVIIDLENPQCSPYYEVHTSHQYVRK